jgi:O-antigen/teichoic acid export membrane protein
MSVLKRNVIANVIGTGVVTVLGIVLVPVYVSQVGVAGYGLIGLYLMLYGMVAAIAGGATSAFNREVARVRAAGDGAIIRHQLPMLELIFWLAAVTIAAGFYLAAWAIASRWLTTEVVAVEDRILSVQLMGVAVAAQLPLALYSSGLLGLQNHVPLTVIMVISTLLRLGGGAIVLAVAPSLPLFFLWVAPVSVLQVAITGWLFRRSLGAARATGVAPRATLNSTLTFGAHMTLLSVLAVLLSNQDKLVLTKVVDLDSFGVYLIAATLATGLAGIAWPVTNAAFPRLTELLTLGDDEELRRTYHRVTQLIAVIVLPIATALALLPREVLFLWTREEAVAREGTWVLALLAAGTAINALYHVPYFLQIAARWTSLALSLIGAGIALGLPATIILTGRFGIGGAALVWLAVNVLFITFGVIRTHRVLLRGEMVRWYGDILRPALVSTIILGAVRMFLPYGASPGVTVVGITAGLVLAFAASALVSPVAHEFFRSVGPAGRRWSLFS